jgi:hypothetical protein
MNPTVAAAAWLILTGQVPAQAHVPLPTAPAPPIIVPCATPPQNHLTVRWISAREYYDRHHHHHRHAAPKAPGLPAPPPARPSGRQ